MRTWLALLFACLALGLVVAGCGDDDDDDGGGGGGGGASTEQPAGGGGGGGANVTMKGIAFNPAEITIKAGDTVTWTNDDDTEHTVTSDDDAFDSGDISGGDTFEQTFDEAGEFAYHCSIHSQMSGTITVE